MTDVDPDAPPDEDVPVDDGEDDDGTDDSE
jgi:hypothetical protein